MPTLDLNINQGSAGGVSSFQAERIRETLGITDLIGDLSSTGIGGVSIETQLTSLNASLTAHIADTTDAHDASAVSVVAVTGKISGSDVQAALLDHGNSIVNLNTSLTALSGNFTVFQNTVNNTYGVSHIRLANSYTLRQSSPYAVEIRPAYSNYDLMLIPGGLSNGVYFGNHVDATSGLLPDRQFRFFNSQANGHVLEAYSIFDASSSTPNAQSMYIRNLWDGPSGNFSGSNNIHFQTGAHNLYNTKLFIAGGSNNLLDGVGVYTTTPQSQTALTVNRLKDVNQNALVITTAETAGDTQRALSGSARSRVLSVHGGVLGSTTNDTLKLASIGFGSTDSMSLGVQAKRISSGSTATTAAIGLTLDVDDTTGGGDASKEIWLMYDGKVGLGTSVPDEKLHVVGSVKATSFIGNASTASTLQTSRTITLSGAVTSSATSFNGSTDITIATSAAALESWVTASLLNSFMNYGIPYTQEVAYYKDTMGIVHIRGIVKRSSGGAASNVIFNLGAGYRPSAQIPFGVYAKQSGSRLTVQVDVLANGNVEVVDPSAVSSTFGLICLEGISFRV